MENASLRLKMSEKEVDFIKDYFHVWSNYMNSKVINNLPEEFQESPQLSKPNTHCHIVFRTLFDLDDIIDYDEEAYLPCRERGSKWSCRYHVIRQDLTDGNIELI
jgi:hypothetical protein